MADQVQGAAGTEHPVLGSSFIGGFAPAAPQVQGLSDAAPEPEKAQTPAVELKPVPPVQEDKKPLAEVIREQRAAREAAQREAARSKDMEGKLAEVTAELERLKKDADPEDIVALAKARGWSKEKQLLMGQSLLYDLAPDKAPPNLRIKLLEEKQERQAREAAEAAKAKEAQADQEQKKLHFTAFVTAVNQAVGAFEPGSHPESEAWFIHPDTGETDQDTYAQSLVATARNLSNVAAKEGRVADLSPANLARVLEAEVTRRMKARDDKRSKRQAAPEVVDAGTKVPSGVQPAESTKGLTGAGTPRPKAVTDAERVQRAIDAGWGRR